MPQAASYQGCNVIGCPSCVQAGRIGGRERRSLRICQLLFRTICLRFLLGVLRPSEVRQMSLAYGSFKSHGNVALNVLSSYT